MTKIEPIQRQSVSDNIITQLTHLITTGQLTPGQRLPSERDLCKQFAVGRSSLREALRSLSTMGIIVGRVGEGTYIAEDSQAYLEKTAQWSLLLDQKKLDDLIETRFTLESQTAFLAAQRATPTDIETLQEIYTDMTHALDNPKRYLELDLQFHLTIAQATQNSVLCNLLEMIRTYLKQSIWDLLNTPTYAKSLKIIKLSLKGHQKILQAIQANQPENARQSMITHIQTSNK